MFINGPSSSTQISLFCLFYYFFSCHVFLSINIFVIVITTALWSVLQIFVGVDLGGAFSL